MNYYTGKTLEDGESVVIAGLEYVDLEFVDNVAGPPFTVSLGYAEGFPHKFEFGIGVVVPLFFEGTMRYEFTPRGNRFINMSFNSHLVKGINIPPYLKYGITASREIGLATPILSYYQYSLYGKSETSHFNNMQTISFGVAIPIKGAYLIPEVDYQFSKDDISDGWPVYVYGIGIRLGWE